LVSTTKFLEWAYSSGIERVRKDVGAVPSRVRGFGTSRVLTALLFRGCCVEVHEVSLRGLNAEYIARSDALIARK
jgi:hypothetical protein